MLTRWHTPEEPQNKHLLAEQDGHHLERFHHRLPPLQLANGLRWHHRMQQGQVLAPAHLRMGTGVKACLIGNLSTRWLMQAVPMALPFTADLAYPHIVHIMLSSRVCRTTCMAHMHATHAQLHMRMRYSPPWPAASGRLLSTRDRPRQSWAHTTLAPSPHQVQWTGSSGGQAAEPSLSLAPEVTTGR